ERAGNEVAPAYAQVRQYRTHLRQIADMRIAMAWCLAENAHLAGERRQQAKDRAHQRCLAGAIGAEHADEFTGADGEARLLQHRAAADGKRCLLELDGVHVWEFASARSSASS